jgi:hypothetical protein
MEHDKYSNRAQRLSKLHIMIDADIAAQKSKNKKMCVMDVIFLIALFVLSGLFLKFVVGG